MKRIEDYIHLYWGSKFLAIPENSVFREPKECYIYKLYSEGTSVEMIDKEGLKWFSNYDDIKLILRSLSDIDHKEELEICKLAGFDTYKNLNNVGENNDEWIKSIDLKNMKVIDYNFISNSKVYLHIENSYEITKYLLDHYFDLFNLFEEGIAINKNKI